MTYTNRLNFAAVVRRAIREGTLTSYERDHLMGRCAVIAGIAHTYEPAWRSILARDEQDEAYERAAARARGNNFARTGGRDWT